MPLLNLSIQALQHHESDSGSHTSELTSLPATEESFSAGSIASVDSFVYPEVDSFPDDDAESYDPYLKPLMKERKARAKCKVPYISPKKKSPMRVPTTPDTAYESLGDSPSLVPSGLHVPNFFSSTAPYTLTIPRRISVVEPESQPLESSIIIHVDEEPKPKPARKERKYWNKIANRRLDHFGIVNLRTAEALIQLGSSHMRCEEYNEALTVFRGATRIFRRVSGGYDLSTAMALNKVGLAACHLNKLKPNLRMAMDALNQSFSARYQLLGPTHVDTVDTLNNMAAVHLHLQEFQEARQAYFEVLTLRELIFGPKHPSVAVTAHCLGGVHMRLGQVVEASTYYYNALDIYIDLCLSEDNPTVARLLTDIASLGRIMSSMQCP